MSAWLKKYRRILEPTKLKVTTDTPLKHGVVNSVKSLSSAVWNSYVWAASCFITKRQTVMRVVIGMHKRAAGRRLVAACAGRCKKAIAIARQQKSADWLELPIKTLALEVQP